MRYLLIFLLFVTFSIQASTLSEPLSLRPDYPQRYLVKQGDTYWSIAKLYLEKPWQWSRLWRVNTGTKKNQQLHPGTTIALHKSGHNPYLSVYDTNTIRLSPKLHTHEINAEILPIPLADIQPFLSHALIMDHDLLLKAPYIVSIKGDHLLGGQGDEVYVNGLHPNSVLSQGTTLSYAIYRPGCLYRDASTHAVIGYNASLVGFAELSHGGKPACLLLTEINQGVELGDRVMMNDFPEFKLKFLPKSPRYDVKGTIIDLPPSYTQGATGLVVVIDKGDNAHLEPGDVLAIYRPNHWVPDPIIHSKSILIPKVRVGEVMVFRTFSNTSLALVVRSTETIHELDLVSNP